MRNISDRTVHHTQGEKKKREVQNTGGKHACDAFFLLFLFPSGTPEKVLNFISSLSFSLLLLLVSYVYIYFFVSFFSCYPLNNKYCSATEDTFWKENNSNRKKRSKDNYKLHTVLLSSKEKEQQWSESSPSQYTKK